MIKKENKFFKYFKRKEILIFALVLFGFLIFSTGKELWRRVELEIEIKKLESEVAKLDSRNNELSGLIEYFNTSTWQEKEIRERLGMQQSGETMVIIPQEGAARIERTELAVNYSDKTPCPKKWLNYFLNKIE